MRLLIAVKSCEPHRIAGYHDVILNTWGRDIPKDVDLRFFTGDLDWRTLGKEIHLNVPDDYLSLPLKTKAILEYSLQNNYDYTFLCDTDTFLLPDRLVRCGFESFDYSGRFGSQPKIGTTFHYKDQHGDYPNCHTWASGGVGYFLSRKASEIVVKSAPEVWAEDMYVGQVLGPYIQSGEITAADLPIECDSCWHFPRREYNCVYDPKLGWMEKMYETHKQD